MTVLVTGAASGIGAALVARLGGDAIGLDRAGVDLCCDLIDLEAIESVSQRIEGALDGIAHVAGLPGTANPRDILAVNLFAPIRLTAALLPRLREGASIVAVSSVTASRCDWTASALDALIDGDDDNVAHLSGAQTYELSKAALNRWVLRTAAALRPRGIRVVTVSPGPVQTAILNDFRASIGADRIAAAAETVGRHGEAGEIADVIAFLLSDDARWINATDVRTDGGYRGIREVEAA